MKLSPNGSGQITLLAVAGIQHIAVDPAGNIYYLQNNIIKRLPAGSNTPEEYAVVSGGTSLDMDGAGNFYLAKGNSVIKISATDQSESTVASGFDNTQGATVDQLGRVFATNIGAVSSGDAIYRITPTGGFHAGALPAGLTVDEVNGTISGTPVYSSLAKDYGVTAYNGSETSFALANMAVTSTDDNLSWLTSNLVSLSPGFDANITSYTDTVSATVTSITVTPTASDNTATILVNGNAVVSDNASGPIDILSGDNTITIAVTASSGATKEYVINVTRLHSNTAKLTGLVIDNDATFDPAFNPDSTNYTISVTNETDSLVITPTANDTDVNILVNGVNVVSGQSSEKVPLAIGDNTISVDITAADNSNSITYTLNVKRAGSSNADLSALTTPDGFLTPAFDTGTTNYTISVPDWVDFLALNPTASDPDAVVTVDDDVVAPGATGYSYYLSTGENIVEVKVAATDGSTTKSYLITVKKGVYPEVYYDPSHTYLIGQPIDPLVPVSSDVDPISVGYTQTPEIITDNLNNVSNVILDEDENVYAATQGVQAGLYKLSYLDTAQLITNQFTQLYGMAINPAGDLFVSDISQTTIFKIAAGTGTAIPIGHDFNNPAGLALDADGNIYLANYGNGIINRLLKSDNYNTIEEIAHGFTTVGGLALDGNKNIYITEIATGNLIKLPAAGNYLTADTLATGLMAPIGIKADPIGNIYVAEAQAQKIMKFPAGGGAPVAIATNISTVSSLDLTYDGRIYYGTETGAIGVIAPLGGYYIDKPLPGGLSFNDTTGVISGTPLVESPDTEYLVTANNVSGTGYAYLNIEVEGGNARLDSLVLSSGTLNPVFDPRSFMYTAVVDSAEATINFKPFASDTAATIKVGDEDVVSGATSSDIALNPGSNLINVVVTSGNGLTTKTYAVTVYRGNVLPEVSYGGGAQVYVINTPIAPLTPVSANVFPPGYSCLPDSLTAALATPIALTADGQGNLYSTNDDDDNSGIYKIDAAGNATLYSTDIASPYGLAADPAGNLFVTDPNAGTVSKIPAGGGTPVPIGLSSGFVSPYAVAVDNSGNAYVSDATTGDLTRLNAASNTSNVLSIGLSSVVSLALDGSRNIYMGTYDGKIIKLLAADNYNSEVILAVDMGFPIGIAVDAANNVFVSDAVFGTFNKISPTGEISTISYCMYAPAGVAVGNNGKVYVADAFGEIDYFSPTGGYHLSALLPRGLAFNDTTGVISGTPTLTALAKDYTVTAYNQFGSSQATVNITVVPSVFNADLSKLGVSGVSLKSKFARATVNYRASVIGTTETVHIRAATAAPGSTMTVNGVPVVSDELSGDIPLAIGANPIPIVVTAEDGYHTKTYTVNVGRGANESRLSSMVISPTAKLVTTGNTGSTINYTASVVAGTTQITMKPLARDKNATVTINGIDVPRGATTDLIDLEPTGPTVVNMVITAQDGVTTSIYAITVIREGSNNAFLKLITLKPASKLVGAHGTADVNYITSVDANTTEVALRPIAEDRNAIITVNGDPVESGNLSRYYPLEETGATELLIHVLAQDGVTTMDYSIKVSRNGSNNARLTSIVLSPTATLVATTNTTTINYTASVDANATQIKLKPTAENQYANILVNNIPVSSGTNSDLIDLEEAGATVINILVTAQDGTTTQGYKITVSKNGSNNAKLQGITLNQNSTVTASSATGYTTSIDAGYGTVLVKPQTEDKNATVTVDGMPVARGSYSQSITLNDVGIVTPVTIIVTAQDGTTSKTYILSIYRNGSNNARLKKVALDPNVTVTATSATGYAATVSSSTDTVGVKITPESSLARATVNGTPAPVGTYIPVEVATGSNSIVIVVTAQDGTIKSYTLRVTRSEDMSRSSLQKKTATMADQNKQGGEVTVMAALSPNGDGINDHLTISNIEAYAGNNLTIMNSKGVQVTYISGYNNTTNIFDGRSKTGQLQPQGTYFYLLEYKDGKVTKRKSGYIVLKY
ncbi:MAG: cadherin-like beta sandwich domain-containing protein [Mucilaginibacter sp.]